MTTSRTVKCVDVVRPLNVEAFNADLAAAVSAVWGAGYVQTSIDYFKNRHDLPLAAIHYTKAHVVTGSVTAFVSASGDIFYTEALYVHGATPNMTNQINTRLIAIQELKNSSAFGARVNAVKFISDKVAIIEWQKN